MPLLKAFILAHDDQIKLVKDIPNKGNVKEVVEHGALNAILMAYKCKMKPNLLLGKLPHSAADIDKVRGDGGTLEDLHVTTVRIGDPDHVKPSVLLGSNVWRASATRLFGLHTRDGELYVNPGAEISSEMKMRADALIPLLQACFKLYLEQRIRQKNKRDHWCLQFARNNLPVVAAIMTLSGHVQSNLECMNERDSLLVTDLARYVKCIDCVRSVSGRLLARRLQWRDPAVPPAGGSRFPAGLPVLRAAPGHRWCLPVVAAPSPSPRSSSGFPGADLATSSTACSM